MRHLVIVPTYNEIENIQSLLPQLMKLCQDLDVLVVDDNSPDGTAGKVKELAESEPRIHLLLRTKKEGLGKAYLAGFQWGLENGFETLTEMDADFSHRPEDLSKILDEIPKKDFIVGSRYVQGGRVVNWSLLRKLISRGGSLYSKFIMGFPLNDWTGGFNCWRRDSLKAMELEKVTSEGYCFQIELKYRALRAGLQGQEVPIVFEDRRVGQSKMSLRIVLEAFYKVWFIRFAGS